MKGKIFKKYLKINDFTQKKAAEMLNVTRETVNTWCKMEEIPDKISQKVKLCFPDFDTMGNHIQSKNYRNSTIGNNNSDICMSNASKSTNNKGIPLIPANAFAGGFSGELQILEYECERYVVPMFKDADFLIPVKGSSMYPKYSSGDVVACRRLTSWNFFQWGKVYVLYTEQGPIIKRICEGKDEEHVLIISDNKERYQPFNLHRSEIIDVAIVMGVIRLE